MALKKMRAKRRNSAVKRIRLTGSGKMIIARANARHYKIKKSRKQTLKANKPTVLSNKAHAKLKKII